MTRTLVVTWVAALLAFLMLAVPLGLLSIWWVFPFLGLHVATLWQLATPQKRSLGTRLARITGWLGCVVVLALYVFVVPHIAGYHLARRVGILLFAPALLAHVALVLAVARESPDEGDGRASRRTRLALYGAGLAGILLIAWVAVVPFDGLDGRSHPGRAIGDIRTVLSAEAAYASFNGGFYDTMECLESPADCLPGYSEGAPVFLGTDIMTTEDGYRRQFHPGPPAEVEEETASTVSASSIRSFAFVAVPREPGKTAERAFCGDSSGDLRVSVDGTIPEIRDGLCPEGLPLLQ